MNQIMIHDKIKCKIGMHVGKEDVVKTAKELLECEAYAIQLYLSNKTSFSPGKPLSKQEVDTLNNLRTNDGLYIVVHGKLILNFCQNDLRNIPALTCDMIEAARINADVIVHQGKNVNKLSKEEALTLYSLNIQEAIDQTPNLKTKILLENSCQQGTELGYNLDDLVTIWRLLGMASLSDVHENGLITNYQERIGFCLDLCHAYVGGMIDMRDSKSVTDFFELFDQKIGLQHLCVIHFNDSEIKFNGHNDSHCDILMGYIGNPDAPINGNSLGFRKIVEYSCKYNIPLIFETPGIIPMNLQLALVQGWALSHSLSDPRLDFENQYLIITQEIRNSFCNNPKSRKGRKAVMLPKETVTAKEIVKEAIVKDAVKEEQKIKIKIKLPLIAPKLKSNSTSSTSISASATSSVTSSMTSSASSTSSTSSLNTISKPKLKIMRLPIKKVPVECRKSVESVDLESTECAICNSVEE